MRHALILYPSEHFVKYWFNYVPILKDMFLQAFI